MQSRILEREINNMGFIRGSCDPSFKFPSSWIGFADLPQDAKILIDDITENVLIRRKIKTKLGDGETVDIFSFDEHDELKEAGLRGARAGRNLKNAINMP